MSASKRPRAGRAPSPAAAADTARRRELADVLEAAARLQEIVPGAVLVGGSAAAYHAGHRVSLDDDHVVADLADRFDTVLDHLEALGDWSTARVGFGKIILGELGGIETGVRQLIRSRPLETETVTIRGRRLVVPTAVEILRIKAWLALTRNQTRDYLDVAALAVHLGIDRAATVLVDIGAYYDDPTGSGDIAGQVARQLADPRPRDPQVTDQLAAYKHLDPRWHDWADVRRVLTEVALGMVVG